MKPFADTAEENKTVVLPILSPYLQGVSKALEIGSGTGQQIVYFARQYPDIVWQPSDLVENLPGIESWVTDANLSNLKQPLAFDVGQVHWPVESVEFIYSSNTLHIMSWWHVECLFSGLADMLKKGGYFCTYGPFSFAGEITSSNQQFDGWLKQRNPVSGVRDVDDLKRLAKMAHLELEQTIELPHNNHILVWYRV